jgi:peptide deformylase
VAKTVNPFMEKLKKNRDRRNTRKAIRTWDDPILKARCEPVQPDDPELMLQAETMIAVLLATDTGVGLAAPQVGIQKRIIILAPNKAKGPITVMVNPEIIQKSDVMINDREACLSFPGISTVVSRHEEITVRYCIPSAPNPELAIEATYKGWEARIVQHEIDHLDGICRVGEAWAEHKKKNPRIDLMVGALVASAAVALTSVPRPSAAA